MVGLMGAGSVWQLVLDNGLTLGGVLMLLPPATGRTTPTFLLFHPLNVHQLELSGDDFLINV